jgi:hypothetical protein
MQRRVQPSLGQCSLHLDRTAAACLVQLRTARMPRACRGSQSGFGRSQRSSSRFTLQFRRLEHPACRAAAARSRSSASGPGRAPGDVGFTVRTAAFQKVPRWLLMSADQRKPSHRVSLSPPTGQTSRRARPPPAPRSRSACPWLGRNELGCATDDPALPQRVGPKIASSHRALVDVFVVPRELADT